MLQVGDAFAKGKVLGTLHEANQIATAVTAVTIEQILAGIDIERRLRIRMQRAESHELVASADMVSGPVVPLQVFQQRQPLFELFQILAHGRCSLFWVERRRGPTVFPGEDGGRVKSFKSAEARSTGEAGKPWARRVPNRGSGEPVHHESSDRALAECVSTMRISVGRNPEPETSGGEWKDLQCDPDLSPAALLSPRSSLPQRTAAVPHCERLGCNDCRGEKTPART